MNFQEAKEQFLKLQEKSSAYEHALNVLYYDGATTAPKATAGNRAHSMGILAEEVLELLTGKAAVELLEYLDAHLEDEAPSEDASEEEQLDYLKLCRMTELMLKQIRELQKIPKDEYVEYRKLMVEAEDVWHTAKENSDFELFRPYLEQLFATARRFAGYLAPEMHPYDYYLNEYEPGLNRKICDEFFDTLRSRLVPLIQKIQNAKQVDDSLLWGSFPEDKQEELSFYLMNLIGLDLNHVGLSTTEHPFTTSLGSHLDERITTNYKLDNFASSMFSVIHEGGHALYDTGSEDSLAYTTLDGGVSMGIHESQSRFYENILGRSEAFLSHILPKLKELFPEQLEQADVQDLYKAINKSQPSLIRTEADEVTYALHVMVRYELEKRIFSDELEVKDLPQAWNALYKEYLGIEVPDDKHGVLQDTHWSSGLIGYFPSYALGSAYGAQFLRKMKETVDVDQCLKEGNFAPINEWNREHIWKFGRLYKPGELLERVFGEAFDPGVYMDYLEQKYKAIYEL